MSVINNITNKYNVSVSIVLKLLLNRKWLTYFRSVQKAKKFRRQLAQAIKFIYGGT